MKAYFQKFLSLFYLVVVLLCCSANCGQGALLLHKLLLLLPPHALELGDHGAALATSLGELQLKLFHFAGQRNREFCFLLFLVL